MRIGVSVYNVGAAELVEVAVAAEAAGFDSLWLGEHLFLPCGYATEHPTHTGMAIAERTHFPRIVDSGTRLTDPWVGLAAAAAATRTLRLATGIYILPLRHPLVTARAAATMADLSEGRFLLGVGTGWLREEFDALDVPFETRGSRHEECLQVLRQAFAGGPFSHQGRHFSFEAVEVSSLAVSVPLILGGNSDAALRRAARLADGWFASGNPSFSEAVALKRKLEDLRGGNIPCYVRAGAVDLEAVSGYREAGFDTLVFWDQDLTAFDPSHRLEAYREVADRIRGALGRGAPERGQP